VMRTKAWRSADRRRNGGARDQIVTAVTFGPCSSPRAAKTTPCRPPCSWRAARQVRSVWPMACSGALQHDEQQPHHDRGDHRHDAAIHH
jgi:hypothetical protein